MLRRKEVTEETLGFLCSFTVPEEIPKVFLRLNRAAILATSDCFSPRTPHSIARR